MVHWVFLYRILYRNSKVNDKEQLLFTDTILITVELLTVRYVTQDVIIMENFGFNTTRLTSAKHFKGFVVTVTAVD